MFCVGFNPAFAKITILNTVPFVNYSLRIIFRFQKLKNEHSIAKSLPPPSILYG